MDSMTPKKIVVSRFKEETISSAMKIVPSKAVKFDEKQLSCFTQRTSNTPGKFLYSKLKENSKAP